MCSGARAEPGNSFFQGEIIMERVALFLSFEPYSKAQQGFSQLNERLEEAAAMAADGRLDKAEEILDYSGYSSDAIAAALQNLADEPGAELDEILQLEHALGQYEANSAEFMLALDTAMLRTLGKTDSEESRSLLASEHEKLQDAVEYRKARTIIKLKAVHEFSAAEAEHYIKQRMAALGIRQEENMQTLLKVGQGYAALARERLEHAHDKGYNTDNLAGFIDKLQQALRSGDMLVEQRDFTGVRQLTRISQQISSLVLSEEDESMFEHEYLSQASHAVSEIGQLGNTSTR